MKNNKIEIDKFELEYIKSTLEHLVENSTDTDKLFKFSDTIDKLEGFYKDIEKDIFKEWDGATTTSFRILACSLNTKEYLSKEQLEYSRDEQGRSFLHTIIMCSMQLGFEQALRERAKETKRNSKLALNILERLIIDKNG